MLGSVDTSIVHIAVRQILQKSCMEFFACGGTHIMGILCIYLAKYATALRVTLPLLPHFVLRFNPLGFEYHFLCGSKLRCNDMYNAYVNRTFEPLTFISSSTTVQASALIFALGSTEGMVYTENPNVNSIQRDYYSIYTL